MSLLSTAKSLSATQWLYLVKSLVLLPIVDVSLRMRGYTRTQATLNRFSAKSSETRFNRAEDEISANIAKVVEIAGRRNIWPTSCLRQALVLKYFLARLGIECNLRIGVKNTPTSSFGAHAWVERNGVVIIGGEHARSLYAKLI
jgi:hypothetical protein